MVTRTPARAAKQKAATRKTAVKQTAPKPRLPKQVRLALADFQRRALELFPDEILQIILYGSHARGDATPDSDVDVMVVVNWTDPKQATNYYLPGASDPRWGQIVDAATDSMIDYGPLISAFPISERLFDTKFPIASAAKQEGIILWQKNNQKKNRLIPRIRRPG